MTLPGWAKESAMCSPLTTSFDNSLGVRTKTNVDIIDG